MASLIEDPLSLWLAAPAERGFHMPGTIVRMSLTDFMQYTSVAFEPGPNLNVVLGPNGAGKSSLILAIALGLGANPRVLGKMK